MGGDRRGQKPVPAHLRALETPTGHKVRDRSRAARRNGRSLGQAPAPPTLDEVPARPPSLREGGRGIQYWNMYWRHASSWLTMADYPMVTRLCELWDMYAQMQAALAADGGPTVVSSSRRKDLGGKAVPHPLLPALRNLAEHMEKLEGDLGLNPVDRARIRIQANDEGSPLDQWQRRRASREAPQAVPTTA